MPDARPDPLDLNNANTRRFPKLAVRNRPPVVVSEGAQPSEDSHNEGPLLSSYPEATRTGSPYSQHPSSQSLQPEQWNAQRQSKAIDVSEQQYGQLAPKKKSAGVFSFLTLKEPSTSAWEEFAEQERRKAAQKHLKSNGVTLSAVSLQRLPDHVPKVNSKWDGLPDSSKRKLDKDREREKAKRSSVTSFASNGSADGQRRSYGSLSSKPAARRSQEKNVTDSRNAQAPAADRPDPTASEFTSEPSSITHPALRHTQGQLLNGVRAKSGLHLPTPPATFRLDSQDNAFESDVPDVPSLQERAYASGTATSPEVSPQTPAFDAVSPGVHYSARSHSPTLLVSTSPRRNVDIRTVVGDEDAVHHMSGSIVTLNLPMMLSAKGSGRSLSAQVGTIMPPIKEMNDSVRVDSRAASPEPANVRNVSRPSRTSATHAMSASRPDSTSNGVASPTAAVKDRQKNEVLPWEMFEPPSESVKNTKRTSEFSKLKRFSKLGRK